MNPPSPLPATCPCFEPCLPSLCRPHCALEVIDSLLTEPGITFKDIDLLLDLRRLLQTRREAETVLALFCELRRRLDTRYYLPLYRLRRWLENHLAARISIDANGQVRLIPIRAGFFWVEPIRRLCLCAALKAGLAPRAGELTFVFARCNGPGPAAETAG